MARTVGDGWVVRSSGDGRVECTGVDGPECRPTSGSVGKLLGLGLVQGNWGTAGSF